MRGVRGRVADDWEPLEGDERGARVHRRGVRLSTLTWERVLGLIVLLGAGAALVGEESSRNLNEGVMLDGHHGLVETLRFSPDGKTLLTSGWDRTVRIWDVEGEATSEFGRELACLSLGDEIYAASISPDCKTVAVAGMGGVVLWNWTREEEEARSPESTGANRSLAFSPDGRLLALGGYDNMVRLLDVKSGRVTAKLAGHTDVIRKMAFTADSRRLISLSFDGRMKCWDLADGREIVMFPTMNDAERPLLAMTLAPDGDLLALSRLADPSSRIEIWDVKTGSLRTLCGSTDHDTHALAFSKDGGVLASSGSDYRVHFWNVGTGQAAGTLEGETGWVRTLDFSNDGLWMAMTSTPDQVMLKRVGLPHRVAVHVPTAPRTPTRPPGRV